MLTVTSARLVFRGRTDPCRTDQRHRAVIPAARSWWNPAGSIVRSTCLSEVTRPAAKRGYNRRWQKARKSYLEAHPLCVQCAKQGKYVRATVVDHIIPHRGDQKLFWDQNNWQSLCKSCHDKKTLTEDINPTYTY